VGTIIGILGCNSVLEKSGQKPDGHAPPSGTGTAARWPDSAVYFG